MGVVLRAAGITLLAGAAVATTTLAASCGFDGAGSDASDAAVPVAIDSPKGDAPIAPIQIDPDASGGRACASPSLQAGAPWPMLGGCTNHAGRSVFRGPRTAPHRLWQADVKTYHPVPSIGADDTIYVPADTDGIMAFSPDGGSRQLAVGGGDVSNTPAIGRDGTLYVGAQNFAVARRPDGGLQRYDLQDEVDTSAVLDANGNVYMGSFSDKVVSLDPAGVVRWTFPTSGDVSASVAIGPNGDVYAGSFGNRLYAIGPDGTKRWEYDTGGSVKSSPVVMDDGTILVGTTSNALHALTPDGKKKWVYNAPSGFDWQVLPALGWDGTIYAPTGSKLTALRPDGTVLWTFDAGGTIHTPAVVDTDGIIYIGGGGGNDLFAITPLGKQLWKVDVGDPPYGFAIGRDSTVYVTCYGNGRIHAFHE